ncbi:MAG: hypothetical protein WBH03_03475 [Cyclobacteriaceae bacterium]
MEQFKIDLHTKETGKPFPEIGLLNESTKQILIEKLFRSIKRTPLKGNIFTTVASTLPYKDFDETYMYNLKYLLKVLISFG